MNSKKILHILLALVVMCTTLLFIKDFKLSWVEVNDTYAEVTINFLVPMAQDRFNECLSIISENPETDYFDYSIDWINTRVVTIKIKETGEIKGKRAELVVHKAPSQTYQLTKTTHIPIQFKTPIQLLNPTEEQTIASTNSFLVQFNTPMNPNKLRHYVECEVPFIIKPYETQNSEGKTSTDLTRFVFTPQKALENGRRYTIALKKGMPSKGGAFLESTQYIRLLTDEKPVITSTYPKDGDKWIGLYPRLNLTSQTPITKAIASIDGKQLEGKLFDAYHAVFILDEVLKPDVTYEVNFQTQSQTGELSIPKLIKFSTTSLDEKRLWLEIIIGTPSTVKAYKGTKLLRTMTCSIGKVPPSLGTYYLQDKKEFFVDDKNKEGANYWVQINGNCAFQGLIRDDAWHIKEELANQLGQSIDRKNIILSEEDAKWIYDNMKIDTMIIIHNLS